MTTPTEIKPGMKFGKLTVVSKSDKKSNKGSIYWNCRCECSNLATVSSSNLRKGDTKSCGCLRSENGYRLMKKRTRGFMLATHDIDNLEDY